MKEAFKAIVDGTYDFQWREEQLDNMQLTQVDNRTYHVLWENKSLYVELHRADFKNKELEIIIRGRLYQVKLEDRFDQLVEKMGLTKAFSEKIKEIHAPMPGLILDILVSPGEEVAKDSHVIVLEAMKMENIITLPTDATVQEILVKKGEAVEKGQVLIKLD